MKKLGAMIIGPGWVAEEHIKGYTKDPRTEVRAIVGFIDKDRAQAQHYIEKYKLGACEYTEDLDSALTRKDIDVASVTTINSMHHPNAMAAIKAGKHVVVEKPLCHSLEQLAELVKAVKSKRVYSHVGHVARFYPAVVGLKNFVDSGAIGKVYYAESDYWHDIKGEWKVKTKTGGSALCMGGCHSVDMVRWMVGEKHKVVEVVAFSEKATWRKDFEYDPTISLMMKFDNGAIGRVSTSLECNMPYVFHIQVNGTDGTVRNNGMYSPKMYPGTGDFMSIPATYPDDWNVAHHPFPEEIAYFIDTIEKGEKGMLAIENAAKTYEVIFAAEKSAREGKVVKLPLLK
jgi:predicted dehydrogenase